jgi:NAD(P)-dependent dehydrogenase (short-subunit alcohol dehydrogenase family)
MNKVLITGASTGIGEACAVYFAERDWQVYGGVRKAADAKRLAGMHKNIEAVTLDVTKPNDVFKTVQMIEKTGKRGGLQGLINNAGIAITGPLEFLPIEDFRRQMEVNFFGQVELTQACLPLLRQGRGRIVNVSSIGGRAVAPFLAPYSASKFALEAYTDGLRRELLPWKMHVASIQAGSIATPIWEKSLKNAEILRKALPTKAKALYGRAMEGAKLRSQRSAERGIPAKYVAKAAWHALTSNWPQTRYVVGRGTRFSIFMLRWLPDELLDRVMQRALYR